MAKRLHSWLFLLLFTLSAGAAPLPEDRGAAGVGQALKRLGTRARVLYIVAHPDDEDAAALTLLARGHGARVTLLSLTRGESGANLITGDFFGRLGALRTLEHRKAAEHYGVELRYTRFADFGYSKNVEETWKNWDRAEVLKDVVAHIRRVRPHVVIARFQGSTRDGHGHHHASGLLAREAFEAAADAARYPELNLPAWSAQKLYSGNWNQLDEGTLAVDAGVTDPLLGRSYAEIGREGYRFQRSQAMGAVLVRPGPFVSHYKLVESRRAGTPADEFFLEGLGADALPPMEARAAVVLANQQFDARRPETIAPLLARALAAVRERDADYAREIERTLVRVLGVEAEALVEPENGPTGMAARFRPASTFQVAAPGQRFRVAAAVHVRSGAKVEVVRTDFAGAGFEGREVEPGRFEVEWKGGRTSAAHWRRAHPFVTSYEYEGPAEWFGWSMPAPAAVVRTVLRYEGVEFTVERTPETRSVDAIGLEVRAPLAVGPPVAVKFDAASVNLPLGREWFESSVTVRAVGAGERAGTLNLELPAGWTAAPASAPFKLTREGEQARVTFRVKPAGAGAERYALRAVARLGGKEHDREFERITYAGLDSLYLEAPARQAVQGVDVKVAPGLRAGYVMGSGDEVPEALRQLGVEVEMLDDEALATADLSRYPVILLGIRAYAAREALKAHNRRLLEYVEKGGRLVVQYNTPEYDANFGPYPYSMTQRPEEISEEDAPVKMLAPESALFQKPNRITEADWQGWVEQRGSKFLVKWDAKYVPQVESQDTGQAPQQGIWLEAAYGKGTYVYCALAWYRQLPFAVPGAVRIFANLVSGGR